jgi:signal transduction histidine kinase
MTGHPFKGLTHRSLRVRVTVVATAVLAIGLLFGTLLLARLFVAERVAAVDQVVKSEAAELAPLAAGNDLPVNLPVVAPTVFAQVVDRSGTVLAATPAAPRVLEMVPVEQTSVPEKDRTYTTTSSALGKGTFRVDVRSAPYKGGSVVIIVAVPFSDVADTLNALHRVILVVLPLVLLAAAAATWLAVGSALRPVDELRAEADAVVASGGSVAPRLAVPAGAAELRRLGETLNRMLARVHGAGEQQRAFIADAAHELRSPLASLLTQLEVALSTPTTAEEWPVIAADVFADAERLRRIADDLLLLAKLDAGAPAGQGLVDITELVGADGPPLAVHGDAQALGRLFDNLVTNAGKYATTVRTSAVREGSSVIVNIDDDGPGVPVEDRERVFERFFRLDSARSRDEGGTGLGLAIARAIARSHGGDVLLSDSPLGGLRATVWLPLAAPSRADQAKPAGSGFGRVASGKQVP